MSVKAGSVCVKRSGKKLRLLIGLPGDPKRFNVPTIIENTEANFRTAERDLVPVVKGLISTCNLTGDWRPLYDRYPVPEIAARLPAGTGRTMDELFENLVQDWKDQNRRSLEDLENKLKEVAEHSAFKGRKICEVTTQAIVAFLTDLRRRGLGAATANRKLAIIRRAFNLAVEQGVLKPSDLPGFPKNYVEPLPRQTRYVGNEVARLVEKAPERHKRLFGLANMIGWRLDEVETLTRSSIDWEGGVLNLDAAASKNGQPRQFPLTPAVRALLKEQLAWVDELQREHSMVIQWLFPNDDPRHKVGDRLRNIRKAMYRACDEAGLNIDPETGKPTKERRWFHDFRRTAQDRMEESLNDTEIMELVGHKTLSMRKRYRGLFDRKRVVRIGAKLAAAEAAVAQKPSNVVPLVPPVFHAPAAPDSLNAVNEKRAVNSGTYGWAGSESNTRHKDFQS